MNTDYSLVLTYRYPGTEWRMADFDYDTLEWLDESPKPTRKQLDNLWEEVQAEMAMEAQQKKTIAASALAKLTKLGLTEKEAKAVIGL
jgi:hypothetical protein